MDTRYLESFAAVVTYGSIAEAGRRVNLTSAGVAQRVRALEAELGTPLVRRVGRRVHPTEAGVAVFSRTRELLEGIRELRQAVVPDTVAGELRLGAISTALTGILPKTVHQLTAKFPRLGIHVAPGTSMDLYKSVVEGELDAAILVQPPFSLPKSCDWRLIRKEPLVLICPQSIGMEDPRKLLMEQPFIRYDRNHWGGRLADEYLRHINITPTQRFELDALEAIAVMVDQGLGISLVPEWPSPWPEGLRLSRLVIPDEAYTRHVGLIWNRACSGLRLIEAFLAHTNPTWE